MALPFIQVGEAVAIRILGQDIGVGDGQTELFQPFVRHRRMHLRGLKRGRQSVRADEMLFRHKQSGPAAENPLRWNLDFLDGVTQIVRLPGAARASLVGRSFAACAARKLSPKFAALRQIKTEQKGGAKSPPQ